MREAILSTVKGLTPPPFPPPGEELPPTFAPVESVNLSLKEGS